MESTVTQLESKQDKLTGYNKLEDVRMFWLKGTENYWADGFDIQGTLQDIDGYGDVVFCGETGWVEDVQTS
jgi:hypothetical protein